MSNPANAKHAKPRYVLSAHAATVVLEREIRAAWIEQVLSQPEHTEPDPDDPGTEHALARIADYGNRVLRVVYNPNVEPWRIVTAYFDRAQTKRMKR